jgi:hypothetical protein
MHPITQPVWPKILAAMLTSPTQHEGLIPGWSFIGVIITALAAYTAARAMHWLQARRELYMEVAAGISRAHRLAAMIGNPETDLTELMAEFGEVADLPAKAAVIGKRRLLKALIAVQTHSTLMFDKMMGYRLHISGHQGTANASEEWRAKEAAAVDQVIELMDRFNLEDRNDQAEWNRLERAFDSHAKRRDEADRDAQATRAAIAALSIEAARDVFGDRRAAVPLIAEAIAAARAELGPMISRGFDKQAFIDSNVTALEQGIAAFERRVDEIERTILGPAAVHPEAPAPPHCEPIGVPPYFIRG